MGRQISLINTGIGFFAFANISVALCNAGAMVVTVISTVTGVFTIGSGVALGTVAGKCIDTINTRPAIVASDRGTVVNIGA